jgi:hypothetical protein
MALTLCNVQSGSFGSVAVKLHVLSAEQWGCVVIQSYAVYAAYAASRRSRSSR